MARPVGTSRNGLVPALHRWAGLIVFVLLLPVAVTGIALNHAENFGLDERFVGSGWLLDAYDIEVPDEVQGVRLSDGRFLSRVRDRIYLGDTQIARPASMMVDATELGDLIVVAMERGVMLFAKDGALIESLSLPAGVDGPLTAVTASPEGALLFATREAVHQTDPELLRWREVDGGTRPTAALVTVPETLAERLSVAYRSRVLTWKRVLIDLHAGRIFGAIGPWIVDLAGIGLLVLALSGIVVWEIKRRQWAEQRRFDAEIRARLEARRGEGAAPD